MSRHSQSILIPILRQEMRAYAGPAISPFGEMTFYFTENRDEKVFCVTAAYLSPEIPATLLLMARVIEDYIVIDHDVTDKPLADALAQAGIPRAQIILAWQTT